MGRALHTIWLIPVIFFASCETPKHFVTDYYKRNETALVKVDELYKALYKEKPFSIEFADKSFNYVSLELLTDTVRYIYEFYLDEKAMDDSLKKYGYNAIAIRALIEEMRSIECTWINKLDYFTEGTRRPLIFLSIRPQKLNTPFTPKKYYIITFYNQPQYYDKEGRLLEGKTLRRLRKVHNEIFWRLNDKVCYTLSQRFR